MERRKPAVLIVEDEPSVALALAYGLTEAGCRVFVATCVEGALEAVATDEFDGALLDFHTPRMTGLELAERLRRITQPKARKWPIWLTTKAATVEMYQRASELGIRNVFIKPFHVRPVINELALVLGVVAPA